MPFRNWKEYYRDEKFWKKVKVARANIPIPSEVKNQDNYIVRLGTGLTFRFRKYWLTSNTTDSAIECIWMFDTVLNPDQYWKIDQEFGKI